MRDSRRIKIILREIEKIWEKYPDMRLGQLITNAVDGPVLYYTEDDDLVEFLNLFYQPKEEK